MKFYPAFLAIVFFSTASAQRPLPGSFDTNNIKKHVLTLASDAFQGRAPFTIGETKTIAYLTDYFKSIGIQTGNGKSYVQQVPVVSTRAEVSPTLEVNTKTSNFQLQNGVDYALYSFEPDAEIVLNNADVIFAGYGISAPSFGHDDYKSISVKDKVVIVLMNERNQKQSLLQKGRDVTYYETNEYKLSEAARQGAKGCLLVQPISAQATMKNIQANLSAAKMHLPKMDHAR